MHLLKLVSLLLFVTVLPSYLFSNLSISGSYQGKNIYVLNPEAEGGFGFCTLKVTVNGDVLPGSTGSSAFEIDFSLFKLQIGDPVFIVIEHNVGCTPKIINPEVLLPRSTFTVLEMNINSQGKLTWKTQ
jgi:hypothetical protein